MHIDQLRYLIEIGHHKSMNVASQQLHISPQALSTSVKKLEQELNAKLLNRSTVGVNLTKEGQQLVAVSERFLDELDNLFHLSAVVSDKALFQTMNFSVPYGFTETHLPTLMRMFFSSYPDIEINVNSEAYQDIIKNVQNNTYSFGITYQMYANDKLLQNDIPDTLRFVPLFSEYINAAIPKDLPISSASSISLNTFVKYPVVMYQHSSYLMSQLFSICSLPPKLINVPSTEATKELLNAGVGISFSMQLFETKRPFIDFSDSVVQVPFKEKVFVVCGYVCSKNLTDSATIAQLNFIEKIYSSLK